MADNKVEDKKAGVEAAVEEDEEGKPLTEKEKQYRESLMQNIYNDISSSDEDEEDEEEDGAAGVGEAAKT